MDNAAQADLDKLETCFSECDESLASWFRTARGSHGNARPNRRGWRQRFADIAASGPSNQTERDVRAAQNPSVCGDPNRSKPWLRIYRLVHIAVFDTGGVELEVQVSAEGAAGRTDIADDLSSPHGLPASYGHRRHVRGHGGHAIPMFDGDMVARPVTGVAGVEHDPWLHGADRFAVAGAEINSGVIARPAAVFTKGGTNHGSRHRRDTTCTGAAVSSAGTATASAGSAAVAS